MGRLVVLLVVVVLVVVGGVGPGQPGVSGAEEPAGPVVVAYSPPVDRPIVDRFRPPATPYAAGNRGIDFETRAGEPVRAAADGEVTFAGSVGASLHVVVLHPDGIRTSYSFLARTSVSRGDRVVTGQPVGTADDRLHLGARAGERYIDPMLLLEGGVLDVYLVPVDQRGAWGEATERAGLARLLAGVARVGGRVAGWGADGATWAADAAVAGGRSAGATTVAAAVMAWREARREVSRLVTQVRTVGMYAEQLVHLGSHVAELQGRAAQFTADQRACTAPTRAPPARRPGRRIAVLVAGFGSVGGDASILAVDTGALGYGPADVAQLSYRGGRVPGVGRLAGVPRHDYGVADSTQDIRVGAAHLRELLLTIRAAHPGVPVDVIAHSQGGLVARAALGEPGDAVDSRLPVVDHLITLGTPHHGADLATANALLGATTAGRVVHGAVTRVTGGAVRGGSVAAGQLAETSRFVADLQRRPLPAGARVTSIAAVGDLVVPALASAVDGATNVLVPVDGLRAHATLPGSPEAHRELALALAGAPPTCRDLTAGLARAAVTSLAEDLVAGSIGVTAAALDLRIPG